MVTGIIRTDNFFMAYRIDAVNLDLLLVVSLVLVGLLATGSRLAVDPGLLGYIPVMAAVIVALPYTIMAGIKELRPAYV